MAADHPPPAPSPASHPAPARTQTAIGLLTLLEALVVLGFAGFYAFEMAVGASDDLTRALTSGILILVFGVGLLALARGWFRGADWPRTPTMLWNLLLLPVAWSLHDSGRSSIALAVGLVAGASLFAAVRTPARAVGAEAPDDLS